MGNVANLIECREQMTTTREEILRGIRALRSALASPAGAHPGDVACMCEALEEYLRTELELEAQEEESGIRIVLGGERDGH